MGWLPSMYSLRLVSIAAQLRSACCFAASRPTELLLDIACSFLWCSLLARIAATCGWTIRVGDPTGQRPPARRHSFEGAGCAVVMREIAINGNSA